MLLTRKHHVRNVMKFLTSALGKGRKGQKYVYPVFSKSEAYVKYYFMFHLYYSLSHQTAKDSLSHQTAKDSIELISSVICDYSRSQNRRAGERGANKRRGKGLEN